MRNDLIPGEVIEKEDLKIIGKTMGNRLKNLRLKNKLTQSVLEKKSKVKKTRISLIERAQSIMSINEAKSLAKALKVTPEWLVAG